MYFELLGWIMAISLATSAFFAVSAQNTNLLNYTKVIECFMFALLISPILLSLTITVLIFRILVTIHFKSVHGGKFVLCSPSDTFVAVEEYANTVAINTFCYVKGQTNLHDLYDRVLTKIISYKSEDGRRPYQKLTWKLVKKFGFVTWIVNNDAFDVRDHVKMCAGMDDVTVYTEQDVQGAIEGWVDHTMSPGKPQWELLFVPKIQLTKENGDRGQPHFAIIFRVQHAYMDGVSCIQILRRFCDELGELTIDPVNNRLPKVTMAKLLGLYVQTFCTTPFTCFKMIRKFGSITPELTKNTGPKYFKYGDKDISLHSVKQIRSSLNSTTSAIFNSAITGAIARAAERKGLYVTDITCFGYASAVLPYPNEDPQNRFIAHILPSPMSIKDPLKRLHIMNLAMKSISPYEQLTMRIIALWIGSLPLALISRVISNVSCGYGVSNLPGFKGEQHIFGGAVRGIYGVPPIGYGVGICVGVCSYNGTIRTSWLVEKNEANIFS